MRVILLHNLISVTLIRQEISKFAGRKALHQSQRNKIQIKHHSYHRRLRLHLRRRRRRLRRRLRLHLHRVRFRVK
tara:strand:+ start:579 stop:803 length:225 start_codon:yes stop_codon:yes gene_type:complete